MQEAEPTYVTSAAGATACTASTSRVSSPYQPEASHSSAPVFVYCEGRTWCSWLVFQDASPWFFAYLAASKAIVGEAYASVIATRTLARVLARAVGGTQLLAGVPLDGVRDLLAVRAGQRGRGVGAVVRGERPRVLEHRGRTRQRVVVVRRVRRVVETGDGQDGTVEAVRRGGRLRRGAVGLRALRVVVQRGAERLLDRGHVTGDRDVVLRGAGDLQPGGLQPGLDGGHLGRRGAEALLYLSGAQVLAVHGRTRVRDGLGVRRETEAFRPAR